MSTVFNSGRQQRTQANQVDTDWTDAKVARLRQMWTAGASQQDIADDLGVTRSAVSGKISRLKLTRDPSLRKPRKPVQVRAARPRKPNPALAWITRPKPVEPPQSDLEAVIDGRHRVQLVELTNTTCRFPSGVVGTADFHFCGVPTADLVNGRPYCREHTKLARRT